MKIKSLIIYLICFVGLNMSLSQAHSQATHEFDSNVFWANHYAYKLSNIKKPNDILKVLNLSKVAQDQIATDISKKLINFSNPKMKIMGTKILIIGPNKKVVSVDFKNYNVGTLYFNNVEVKLDINKSYFSYNKEIANILSRKKISQLNHIHEIIFSKAYAQGFGNGFSRFMASFFTSAASNTKSISGDIGEKSINEAIIETYLNEADHARRVRSSLYGISSTTLAFSCSGGELQSVYESQIVDGIYNSTQQSHRRITPTNDGGFEFKSGKPGEGTYCISKIDTTGLVLSTTGNGYCPEKNTKIFEDPSYFGGFPMAAATCCAKKGCYEEVSAKYKSIRAQLIGRPKSGQESSDSGTVD